MKLMILLIAILFSLALSAQVRPAQDTLINVKMLSLADLQAVNKVLGKQLLHDDWVKVVAAIDEMYFKRKAEYVQAEAKKKELAVAEKPKK